MPSRSSCSPDARPCPALPCLPSLVKAFFSAILETGWEAGQRGGTELQINKNTPKAWKVLLLLTDWVAVVKELYLP